MSYSPCHIGVYFSHLYSEKETCICVSLNLLRTFWSDSVTYILASEKIGCSGTKLVILKYSRYTTYCSTSQQWERQRSRNHDCMMHQPSSHSTDSRTAPRCHGYSFSCSSTAPWNNYHHFPRFWDQLYGPLRLGLSTEVHFGPNFISDLIGESPVFPAAIICEKTDLCVVLILLPTFWSVSVTYIPEKRPVYVWPLFSCPHFGLFESLIYVKIKPHMCNPHSPAHILVCISHLYT